MGKWSKKPKKATPNFPWTRNYYKHFGEFVAKPVRSSFWFARRPPWFQMCQVFLRVGQVQGKSVQFGVKMSIYLCIYSALEEVKSPILRADWVYESSKSDYNKTPQKMPLNSRAAFWLVPLLAKFSVSGNFERISHPLLGKRMVQNSHRIPHSSPTLNMHSIFTYIIE